MFVKKFSDLFIDPPSNFRLVELTRIDFEKQCNQLIKDWNEPLEPPQKTQFTSLYQLAYEAEELINRLNQLFFNSAHNQNFDQYYRLQRILTKAHCRYKRRFNKYLEYLNCFNK